MVRPVKENTDPNAKTTYKTCGKCKESKLLVEFPFSYKKYKNEKHIGYKCKCRTCECEQQKQMYKQRQEKKALTIAFDGHLPSSDGALIKIENVEANNEK
jgi:hypothetical protein